MFLLPSHPLPTPHLPTYTYTEPPIAIKRTKTIKIGVYLSYWYEDTKPHHYTPKTTECVSVHLAAPNQQPPILSKVWRYIPEPICMYTYISTFFPDENFTLSQIHRKRWISLTGLMSLNIPQPTLVSTEKTGFGKTDFSLKTRPRNFKDLYQIPDIWNFSIIELWLKNRKISCQ